MRTYDVWDWIEDIKTIHKSSSFLEYHHFQFYAVFGNCLSNTIYSNLHSLCSESKSWSLKSDCIQTTSMLLWIVLQKFTKRFRSNFITLTSYTRDIKANSIFYFRLNSLKLQRMHHPIILKTIHRALYRAMTTASPVAGSTVHAAPRPQPR